MNTWMKYHRFLLVALSVAAVSVAGCGDDDDNGENGANGTNGTNGTGPDGSGAEITPGNVQNVQAEITTIIVQALAKGPGTHQGADSGTVTVSSLMDPMEMEFNDYSDDGEMWLDGTVRYSTSGTSYNYSVDLMVSGAYEGDIEGDVSSEDGDVSGYWIVDGQRIEF